MINVKELIYEGAFKMHKPRLSSARGRQFSVSELKRCPRKLAYQVMLGTHTPFDAKRSLIYARGNALEYMLIKHLKKVPNLTLIEQKEVYIDHNGYTFVGHIDAVLTYRGETFPIEIKSASENVYVGVKNIGPKEEDVMQLSAYIIGGNYAFGRLLYINANNSEMCEFDISIEEAMLKINTRLDHTTQALTEMLDQNLGILLGKKPAEIADKRTDCFYCTFAYECKLASDFKVPIKQTEVDFTQPPF